MKNKKTLSIIVVLLIVVILIALVAVFILNRGTSKTEVKEATVSSKETEQEVVVDDTIIYLVDSSEEFSLFTSAAKKAGLTELLSGEQQYTVFMPSDDAFKKIYIELDVSESEFLERNDLENILKYHIVSGKTLAQDVYDLDSMKTINGKSVTINEDDKGNITVNSATIVQSDIEGSNGVIHVIDKVLIPQ